MYGSNRNWLSVVIIYVYRYFIPAYPLKFEISNFNTSVFKDIEEDMAVWWLAIPKHFHE